MSGIWKKATVSARAAWTVAKVIGICVGLIVCPILAVAAVLATTGFVAGLMWASLRFGWGVFA